jgi:hypothetical protein
MFQEHFIELLKSIWSTSHKMSLIGIWGTQQKCPNLDLIRGTLIKILQKLLKI